eukprot:TRINITY_DN983_c0_g1_i1.p1 TRINITY_DN983_c0_g1~~TRINITY_DN983_c0_g1_i1.p1  ORF type:complete len:111 (-),score=8.89 TRINITY_DN983_c0_g1_i1:66-353(-)
MKKMKGGDSGDKFDVEAFFTKVTQGKYSNSYESMAKDCWGDTKGVKGWVRGREESAEWKPVKDLAEPIRQGLYFKLEKEGKPKSIQAYKNAGPLD